MSPSPEVSLTPQHVEMLVCLNNKDFLLLVMSVRWFVLHKASDAFCHSSISIQLVDWSCKLWPQFVNLSSSKLRTHTVHTPPTGCIRSHLLCGQCWHTRLTSLYVLRHSPLPLYKSVADSPYYEWAVSIRWTGLRTGLWDWTEGLDWGTGLTESCAHPISTQHTHYYTRVYIHHM